MKNSLIKKTASLTTTKITIAAAMLVASQWASAETYTVDVWADNWFQFNVNGVAVAEDSVPITTERSFNAETFSFDSTPPFTIGLIAKDFIENDTGLEYIGSRRQQMGDGGVIAQVADSSGNVIAVTDSLWKCMVIHEAPLDKKCADSDDPQAGVGYCGFETTAEPADWGMLTFDDSEWPAAQMYSTEDVRPKGGYDQISWDENAELIWGPDLETNNTLLCRLTIGN